MTDITHSVVISNASVGGNVTNNSHTGQSVTPDMWNQLVRLASEHSKAGELEQLLRLRDAINQCNTQDVKSLWSGLRSFFGSLVQRSANLAQIIGTIDAMTK